MKKVDYYSILKLFICPVPFDRWPAITKPFTSEDWNAATNGHIACCIPRSVYKKKLPIKGAPRVRHVYKTEPLRTPINVPVDFLRYNPYEDAIAAWNAPKVPTTCHRCSGTGQCVCHCGNHHNCERCQGNRLTPDDLINPIFIVKPVILRGVAFDYKYLSLIYQAAVMAGAETVTFTALKREKPAIIQAGELEFALMPLLISNRQQCATLSTKTGIVDKEFASGNPTTESRDAERRGTDQASELDK